MTDDQPRWPRGTPVALSGKGPGGGRFRSGGATGWVAAVAAAMSRVPGHHWHTGPDFDELEQLVQQPITDESKLSGGAVAQTSRVTFQDGRQAIRKVHYPEDADREYLASLVGHAVGAPVPAAIHDPGGDNRITWMGIVDGRSGHQLARATMGIAPERVMLTNEEWQESYGITGQLEKQWAATEPGWRIALLDVLLDNKDRHPGNWMLEQDTDRPVGVDHNSAWTRMGETMERLGSRRELTAPTWLLGDEIGEVLLGRGDNNYNGHWMTIDEVHEIDARLEALRPEFERFPDGDKWYGLAMARWRGFRADVIRDRDPSRYEPQEVTADELLQNSEQYVGMEMLLPETAHSWAMITNVRPGVLGLQEQATPAVVITVDFDPGTYSERNYRAREDRVLQVRRAVTPRG